MANSSVKTRAPKARKPGKDFPLFKHARGYWAKKVKGKTRYLLKISDDPEGKASLDAWLERKDTWLAGREWTDAAGLTVEDLCDHFINGKKPRLANGEITRRTYDHLDATCQRIIDKFGAKRLVDDLRPEDFDKLRADVATRWGAQALSSEVQRVRTVFKYAFDAGHLERPVRFGPNFKKPTKKVMRLARAQKGVRLFETAEIRGMLDKASPQLKAMILLGVNCGFGNADCGLLPIRTVDLKAGWIEFPRPKTGIARRCPLWKETVDALKTAIAERPQPKAEADAGLLFVTKYGGRWHKETSDNPISKEFRKLLDDLGIYRPGLGFYALRHCFETFGGESRDQVAVNAIMGHVDATMAGIYREHIDDSRLRAVVNHVHDKVFPPKKTAKRKGGAK